MADTREDERCVAVCCAVCDDMREDLVLTSSVIDKLGASQIDGVNVGHDLSKVDDDHHDDDYSNSQDSTVINETVSANVVMQSEGHENGPLLPLEEEVRDRGEDVTPSHVQNNSGFDPDIIMTGKSSDDTVPKTVEHNDGQSLPSDEYDMDGLVDGKDSVNASADELKEEQKSDYTLKGPRRLASRGRGNFFCEGRSPLS